MKAQHPTRETLIAATQKLLESNTPQELTIEMVLKESGISHGSLYHHFGTFPALIDHALVSRFASYVDHSIALLTKVLVNAHTREELLPALKAITAATQGPELRLMRAYRMEALSQANQRSDFRKLLGVEQQRLTDALADLVRDAQNKGLYRAELDPTVVAVFIQSYTIGKAVDDVTDEHVPQAAWNNLIDTIIEKVFLA